MYEVGADYNLSKRTKLYALYAKVNNDNFGTYGVGGSAERRLRQRRRVRRGSGNGNDVSAFSLGMRHTF